MKALSLWQPWASLWACGRKRFETRDWSTPYRGPLLVHAAKTLCLDISDELRAIRIQDGSLLDEGNMAAIAEAAKENDYQVWIERVEMDAKVGVIIEDGMVKARATEEAAA